MLLQLFRNSAQAAHGEDRRRVCFPALSSPPGRLRTFGYVLEWLRSAPYIYNKLSDAIEWIILNKCSISFVCHILDDFVIVELPCATSPPDSDTTDSDSLFTDASGSLGFGGIFPTRWFQGKWLPSQQLSQQGINILWQELYAITVKPLFTATSLLRPLYFGRLTKPPYIFL